MLQTISYYLRTYQNYALDFWENITPMQYGIILILVAVCGYIMMKAAR